MVAGYIKPEIVIPGDAVGIDLAIGKIQKKFASLTWLEKVFGKCTIQHEMRNVTTNKGLREKDHIFPQVYQANSEPYDLMMNDNLKSYCFFIAHDPGKFQNYDFSSSQHYISRDVSIVFWMNCKKVNQDAKRPMNEAIIMSVLSVLKLYSGFVFDQVYEEYDNVFKEFSITENFRQYMKFPYSAFRIDGQITFPIIAENCQTTPPVTGGQTFEPQFEPQFQ